MDSLIANFSKQMREANEIGQNANLSVAGKQFSNITLFGLGGSAFGGEVIRNYIYESCELPFNIIRDYRIPGWIGEDSLVIVSSYSGNTEETLAAFEAAEKRSPRIVCVSSNGRVLEKAREKGYDFIQLPGGFPPRAAAALSITQLLFILRHFDLISDFSGDFEDALDQVENFQDKELAKELAGKIHGNFPVIYSTAEMESVAIRWRQQIEENGKHLCSHHVVPEMNHNELVGWKQPGDLLKRTAVFFLESNLDYERNLIRMSINKDIISKYAGSVTTVKAKGKTRLGQIFYWLHLGDWASFYLSELNGEDPTPVKVIDFLKSELAKK